MVITQSERQPAYETLRKLVLEHGGVMNIIPDVLRAKSFHGWNADQIRGLVYKLRKEARDGEMWALYQRRIYAKAKDLPPEFWRKICDRRALKISGVADQNRIYEKQYKKIRQEKEAQKVLDENIKILSETMISSIKVIRTLDSFDNPDDKKES